MQAEADEVQFVNSGLPLQNEETDNNILNVKRRPANPFAKRPALDSSQTLPTDRLSSTSTFTRSSILPTARRRVPLLSQEDASLSPATSGFPLGAPFQERPMTELERRQDKKWRLLWRGGLEVGPEGYKLDGITFIARLSFPMSSGPNPIPIHLITATPDRPTLSRMITPENTSLSQTEKDRIIASPFRAPVGKDTDLCLGLESMRGRKTLRLSGVEEVGDDEIETSDDGDDGTVRVYINPISTTLQEVVVNLLNPTACDAFNAKGRTRRALILSLGDDGANIASNKSTFIIYGQAKGVNDQGDSSKTLELLASRRKAKPINDKPIVRPGDPLPREMALAVPFRHSRSSISRATSLLPTRGFSREPSQPNIYAPPTLGVPFIRARSEVKEDPKSEPKPTKVTPGRRGEKRKKDFDVERAEAESRRKKAGRVTASSLSGSGTNGLDVILNGSSDDPFAADFAASSLVDVQQSLVQKSNEFETKNKASIKKRLLGMMELRGVPRSDDRFRDIFTVANKGITFAFRDQIRRNYIPSVDIENIIGAHLDMYIPPEAIYQAIEDEN